MTTTVPGAGLSPTITRGMPTRATDSQEMLQKGYLYAVAAAAGCNVWQAEIDEGIDAMLSHRASVHLKDEAFLKIQMKATAAQNALTATHATAKMSRARYNQLRDSNVTICQIVVILHHPGSQADWVEVMSDVLGLRHRAYWVSLRDVPEPAGSGDYVTVRAPLANIFDDVSLCRMMANIGQGRTL